MDKKSTNLKSFVIYSTWLFGKNKTGILSFDGTKVKLINKDSGIIIFNLALQDIKNTKSFKNILWASFAGKKYYITFNQSAMQSTVRQRPFGIESFKLKKEMQKVIGNSFISEWKTLLSK